MYPLLAKLPKGPASLCTQLRTILLAAGHVAAGDAGAAAAAFQHMNPKFHAKAYELTIVQAPPFIGIPRALHSAAALQAIGITGKNEIKTEDGMTMDKPIEQIRKRGEDVFRTVYGRNEGRVRDRLKTFHPALEDWIMTCVYGWTATRAPEQTCSVSLRERELCTVAMLAVDCNASVQLASHIRGALLTGCTKDEVEHVIRQTEVTCEAAASSALAVWETYSRARYAL